jgi:hypothetical protein
LFKGVGSTPFTPLSVTLAVAVRLFTPAGIVVLILIVTVLVIISPAFRFATSQLTDPRLFVPLFEAEIKTELFGI